MNAQPLIDVKNEILADPESLEMDEYFSACGTRMCIAGRLAYNAGWSQANAYGPYYRSKWVEHAKVGGMVDTVEHVASEILGVTELEAARLFHVSGWPKELSFRWELTPFADERAAIAALRIDQFIIDQLLIEKEREGLEYLPELRYLDFGRNEVVEDKTCAVV